MATTPRHENASAYDQMMAAGLITPAMSPGHACSIQRSMSSASPAEVLNSLRDDR